MAGRKIFEFLWGIVSIPLGIISIGFPLFMFAALYWLGFERITNVWVAYSAILWLIGGIVGGAVGLLFILLIAIGYIQQRRKPHGRIQD